MRSRSALRSSAPKAFTNSREPSPATPKYGVEPRASTPARSSWTTGRPTAAKPAITASRVGRRVDPANELLWRGGLRAEYLAGNREAQRRFVDQLLALADDLESDLEPETERLLAELERHATPVRAAQ